MLKILKKFTFDFKSLLLTFNTLTELNNTKPIIATIINTTPTLFFSHFIKLSPQPYITYGFDNLFKKNTSK